MSEYLEFTFDHIDSEALSLTLPERPDDGSPRRVCLRQLRGLSGKLWQAPDGPHLSKIALDDAQLEELALWFGSVHMSATGQTQLTGVTANSQPRDGVTDLDVALTRLQSDRLSIDVVDSVKVSAGTTLTEAALRVRGPEGDLRAAAANFRELHVAMANTTLTFSEISAEGLHVSWKPGAFFLRASRLAAESIHVVSGSMSASLKHLTLGAFELDHGDIVAENLKASVLSGQWTQDPQRQASEVRPHSPQAEKAAHALIDWRLLDRLGGQMNADVAAEVELPVASRKGVHRFRLPVEEGTLNYRQLEDSLAPLEDSLLDFSLRDGQLVLELGIPLLPTRGRGKPLLRWSLDEQEVALAKASRVRLSRLPRFERKPAAEDEQTETDPARRSPVDFRRLTVCDIDVNLRLLPPIAPLDAVLEALSFEALHLQGVVHHDPKGHPKPGELLADGKALAACVRALPVGDKALQLGSVSIESLSSAVRCAGMRPLEVEASLEGLEAARIELSAASPSD